jgi:signal transduction histidine kinase
LSIVQDIVQAHSGTLTLANATPHGLIVEIRLPPVEPIIAGSREETRSPGTVKV